MSQSSPHSYPPLTHRSCSKGLGGAKPSFQNVLQPATPPPPCHRYIYRLTSTQTLVHKDCCPGLLPGYLETLVSLHSLVPLGTPSTATQAQSAGTLQHSCRPTVHTGRQRRAALTARPEGRLQSQRRLHLWRAAAPWRLRVGRPGWPGRTPPSRRNTPSGWRCAWPPMG